MMTGCLRGRGETENSIWGLALANLATALRRKELGGLLTLLRTGEGEREVLHALGASGPVAVVEVEAFTLEYEGSDAILGEY